MKITIRIASAALFALFGGWALIYAESGEHGHHGQAAAAIPSDTITGEVVDLACYLGHGSKGKDHAKCAKQCIKKGLPVGLLTETGEIYLAVGPDHKKANEMLAAHAAKTVTVVGRKAENSGMKIIEVRKVSGDSGAKAVKAPADTSAVYTCPMHPEVRGGPGKCPQCGMNLEKAGKPN